MVKELLQETGLSRGESEIYLILIKLGESSATQIAKYTKIARPNVYDYLNKLKERGFVSFINKNGKTHYLPSPPQRIVDYLEEKKYLVENNLERLNKLYVAKKEAPTVEIFEGEQGFKFLINDIITTKKNFVGWGGSDKLKEYVPEHIIKRYLNLRKKNNIRAKLLYAEKESILKTPLTQFKAIPRVYTSPSTTLTYADCVATIIYSNIPIIIFIKNKEVAESYQNHFKLLWKKVK